MHSIADSCKKAKINGTHNNTTAKKMEMSINPSSIRPEAKAYSMYVECSHSYVQRVLLNQTNVNYTKAEGKFIFCVTVN